MSEVHFLPWMRSGLGRGIAEREPESLTAIAGDVAIEGRVEIDGQERTVPLSLRPPSHVTALDTAQIARRYPAPGVADAEYGYFPHVEFTAPDLPWIASPRAADETEDAAASTGRLRPWIVLVCVPAAQAVLAPGHDGAPQTLTVDAALLPDLGESWAWAHVQSAVPPAEAAAAALVPDGSVVSRLICPLRLAPATRYRAAVVNAWRAEGTALHPAWQAQAGEVGLSVYDSWTFTTGQTGSFEELVERLMPAPAGGAVYGLQTMDLTECGMIGPFEGRVETPVRSDFSGALRSIGAEVAEPDEAGKLFAEDVAGLIDSAGGRRSTTRSAADPVVTLPCYGSFAAGAAGLPSSGWLVELNTLAHRRAAAGLGAAIVRRHQERLMAAAWDQAGQLREANRVLTRAVLRRETARAWKAKAVALDPGQMLAVLQPQLTFLKDSLAQPLRRRLRASNVPDGTVSPAMARILRPSFTVQKALTSPTRRQPLPSEELPLGRARWRGDLETQLDGDDTREALALRVPRTPDGMRGPDPRRGPAAIPLPGGGRFTPRPLSLSETRDTVANTLRPEIASRRQIEARVPVLASVLAAAAADVTPTRTTSGPVFGEALSLTLMRQSAELMMPGVRDFPENTIQMVAADPGFAAALLAGANHEMIRELVWREYPADLRHTSFRRFWARPDPAAVDIDPMHEWDYIRPLAFHGAAGGESAVLLVRGDLIRQFPAARFLLLAPGATVPDGPAFGGRIGPDTAFFGFDVPDAAAVTDPGGDWLVIIEEPGFEPRFGLDLEPDPAPLTSYRELAWAHLQDQSGDHLALAPETAIAGNGKLEDEALWGRNGAHMAKIVHQQPFRYLCRAAELVGGRP